LIEILHVYLSYTHPSRSVECIPYSRKRRETEGDWIFILSSFNRKIAFSGKHYFEYCQILQVVFPNRSEYNGRERKEVRDIVAHTLVAHTLPVLLYFFHSHFLLPAIGKHIRHFFYGSYRSDFWFKKFFEQTNSGIKNFSTIGSLVSKLSGKT